jgi:hypothetical protein
MADKRWKEFERRVARAFGTERTPLSGGNSKHTHSDTLHPELYIECKSNFQHPLLREWGKHKARARRFGLPVLASIIMPAALARLCVFRADDPPPPDPFQRPWTVYHVMHYERRPRVWHLFLATHERAYTEEKVPVVVLGVRGKQGMWIVTGELFRGSITKALQGARRCAASE